MASARRAHGSPPPSECECSESTHAAERLRDQRTEKLLDVEKLIDASYLTYATQLRDGKVRMSPADLPRLHKLRSDLWTETDTPAAEPVEPEIVETIDPAEHRLQVLRALDAAGVLGQLLGRDHDEHAEADQHDDRNDQDDSPGQQGTHG